MWEVELKSGAFLPFLPEEAQANPGVYGFELASWLAQELAGRGMPTSYPAREDWGWLIEHKGAGGGAMIGCASVSDPGEGYLGRPIQWRIFIEAARSGGGWFGKKGAPVDTSALEAAIEAALASGGHAFTRSEE